MVSAEFEHDSEVVAEGRQNLGRFVLATNDRGLSPDELLTNYKEQGAVERGFRFIKGPSFGGVEIYLKKPFRIQTGCRSVCSTDEPPPHPFAWIQKI